MTPEVFTLVAVASFLNFSLGTMFGIFIIAILISGRDNE